MKDEIKIDNNSAEITNDNSYIDDINIDNKILIVEEKGKPLSKYKNGDKVFWANYSVDKNWKQYVEGEVFIKDDEYSIKRFSQNPNFKKYPLATFNSNTKVALKPQNEPIYADKTIKNADLIKKKIKVMEQESKVENNSADLIDKKIRGLKIALKFAIKEEKELIKKRIKAFEIAKKMSIPKVSVAGDFGWYNDYSQKEKDAIEKKYGTQSKQYKVTTLPKSFDWKNADVIGVQTPTELEENGDDWLDEQGIDKKKFGVTLNSNYGQNSKMLDNLIGLDDESYYVVLYLYEKGTDNLPKSFDWKNAEVINMNNRYDLEEQGINTKKYWVTKNPKGYINQTMLDNVMGIDEDGNYYVLYLYEKGSKQNPLQFADGLRKNQLVLFKNKYFENEDNNKHSENVLLLAQNFGTQKDIDNAIEIVKDHEKDGQITSENRKKRMELDKSLMDKAIKIMSENKIMFFKNIPSAKVKNEVISSKLNKGELFLFKNKYFENESNNRHSENVLLLAQNFGTQKDIDNAVEIVKDHEKDGNLTTENYEKRTKLEKSLMVKAKKIMAENNFQFSKGGILQDSWRKSGQANLSKEETKKIALKYADGLSMAGMGKFSVNNIIDEDSFDLDLNDIEYDGGSYVIFGDGSVVNMAITPAQRYGSIDSTPFEIKNKAIDIQKQLKNAEFEDLKRIDGSVYGKKLISEIKYKKGGYTRPSNKINTTGFFLFETKDDYYIVRSSFFERQNDIEDSLEIQDKLREKLGSIIISNSAWKRLSDGNTIKARSNKGNLIGTLTRLSNLEDNYNLNKMAKGGKIEDAELYVVVYEINGKKQESEYLLYPNERVEKKLPSIAKILSINKKMAKGGILENAQTSFTINNDYIGNLELGFNNIEFKNEKGKYISSKSFFKLNDAFEKLFEYIKSENGQYIIEKDPKSNFYIEELFYDGKSTDKDGLPNIKYKTIFKISSKKINDLMNSNNFKDGGSVDDFKIWEILYLDKGVQKSILVEGYSSIIETNNWKKQNPNKEFIQIRLYGDKVNDYAKGGSVRYVDTNYTQNSGGVPYFLRFEDAVGSFAWRYGKYNEGILYNLSDFDKEYYSHLPLKNGEKLFRYSTDRMIDGSKYLIKINLLKGLIYFMSEQNDMNDDKNISFETRGIKSEYITLDKDKVDNVFEKYATGGGVKNTEKYNVWSDALGKYVTIQGEQNLDKLHEELSKIEVTSFPKKVTYDQIKEKEIFIKYQANKMANGGSVAENEIKVGQVYLHTETNEEIIISKIEDGTNEPFVQYHTNIQNPKIDDFNWERISFFENLIDNGSFVLVKKYANGGSVDGGDNTNKELTKQEILSKYKGKYLDLLIGEDGKHEVIGVSNTKKPRYFLAEEWYNDLYAKGGNVSSIEKKVQEVNRLIDLANKNDISVIDSSSTWESPMKYKPIKYSNGTLYIEYQELDLYKNNRTGINEYVTKKDKVLKRNMEFDNPLNDIAKMYRKALKQADIMFEDGGSVDDGNMLINKEDGTIIVGIKSKEHESSLDKSFKRPTDYDESRDAEYISRVFNSEKAFLYNFFDKYGNQYEYDELVEKNKKMVKGGGVDDIKIDNNNRYDIAILFDNTNNKYIIEKEKIINLLNKFSFVVIDATFNKTMTDKKYDLLYIKLNYSENYKEKLSLLELLKELSKLENNYESIDDVVVFTKKYRGGRPIEKKDFYESGGEVGEFAKGGGVIWDKDSDSIRTELGEFKVRITPQMQKGYYDVFVSANKKEIGKKSDVYGIDNAKDIALEIISNSNKFAKGGKVKRDTLNVLNELYDLKDDGVTEVQLNGFYESIGYVIGLELNDTEIKKVGNNAYITLYENGGSVDSADSNNLVNIDIYKLAEEMSEKDFRNKFLTLSKSEKENVESLIRLGDDKKIALMTILGKREETNNDDVYKIAYNYAKGGNVDSKGRTIPQSILDYRKNYADGDENTRIRTWYMKTYPQDNRGQYIDLYNTFEDLWIAIQNNEDVYNTIVEADSLIRERLFSKLSDIKGVTYKYIYDKWLGIEDLLEESENKEYKTGGSVDNFESEYNSMSKNDKEELMRETIGVGRTPFSEYEKYNQLSSYHKELVDNYFANKFKNAGGVRMNKSYNNPENATHVLHIDNQNWYLEKIDSTHFYMSNDPNFRGMAHHIGQHNGEIYYDEVKQWLKDTQYAKGGSIKEFNLREIKSLAVGNQKFLTDDITDKSYIYENGILYNVDYLDKAPHYKKGSAHRMSKIKVNIDDTFVKGDGLKSLVVGDLILIKCDTSLSSEITFVVSKSELNKIPYSSELSLEEKAKEFVYQKSEQSDNPFYVQYYFKRIVTNKVLVHKYLKGHNHTEYKIIPSSTKGGSFYIETGTYHKFGNGGGVDDFSEYNFQVGDKLDLGSKGIKYFKQYDGEKIIVVDSKSDLKSSKGSYTYPSSVKKVLNKRYSTGGGVDNDEKYYIIFNEDGSYNKKDSVLYRDDLSEKDAIKIANELNESFPSPTDENLYYVEKASDSRFNYGNINKRFLNSVTDTEQVIILENIANHYEITQNKAYAKVTDVESELLEEYITDISLRRKVYSDRRNRRYADGGRVDDSEIKIATLYGKMLNQLGKEKQFNKKFEKKVELDKFSKSNGITIDNNNIISINGIRVAFIDKINQKTGQEKSNWEIKKFDNGGSVESPSQKDMEIVFNLIYNEIKKTNIPVDMTLEKSRIYNGVKYIGDITIYTEESDYIYQKRKPTGNFEKIYSLVHSLKINSIIKNKHIIFSGEDGLGRNENMDKYDKHIKINGGLRGGWINIEKYAKGGSVETQKERVIDYYINNADNEDLITLIGVRDFPNLIGVAEKWVNNRDTYYDKIYNAIDGIHNRTWGENKFVELGLEKFADGGSVDEQTYIDLFEDYENIPAEVQIILDEYSESFEDGDYTGMSKAQDELKQIGYTFNFYVDGDAYGLRPTNVKLSQLKGYEDADDEDEYAQGGSVDDLAEFIVSTNVNSRNNGMNGKSKGDLIEEVYGQNYSNVDSALPLGLLEEMNINNDERWRYVMDYQNGSGGKLTDLINSLAEKNPYVVIYDKENSVDNLPILSAMEKYKNSNYMFDFYYNYMVDWKKLSYKDFVETLRDNDKIDAYTGKTTTGMEMFYLPNGHPSLFKKFSHKNNQKAYKEYLSDMIKYGIE